MIQMVVVGQSIGNLDVVLKELSVYYERQKKLNYQIQDAITYPFVLILMMFVIVAALIFKVFPIFENILRQMSMSLSLMNTARILSYIGFFILLVILVCGVILFWVKVPVLSLQMTETHPKLSTEFKFLIIAFSLTIF